MPTGFGGYKTTWAERTAEARIRAYHRRHPDRVLDKLHRSAAWVVFAATLRAKRGSACERCKPRGVRRPAHHVRLLLHPRDWPEMALDPENAVLLCHVCEYRELIPEAEREAVIDGRR